MYSRYLMSDATSTTDLELHRLAEAYGELKGIQAAQGTVIGGLERKLDEVPKTIASSEGRVMKALSELRTGVDTKTRMPMLPHITMLIVAGGFLLTIMTLLFTPMQAGHQRLEQVVTEHTDGHPVWVVEIMKRMENRLSELIAGVDKKHAEEHVEQEDDIEQLRVSGTSTKEGVNGNSVRISVLETQMHERTEWFKSELAHRDILRQTAASDRWTATEERIKTESHNREHQHQDDRIRGLEDDHRQWGRTNSGPHSGH